MMRLDYPHLAANGMKALGGVYMYVSGCGLTKALVDLVYLRASQINGCAYCIDSHSRDLLAAGVPAEKLLLVSAWREADTLFSDRERAALAWTEAVTLVASTRISDGLFATVSAQFSEKEVADLTLSIGLINTYNRIAISFRRGPEVHS
jgi:AhpD family alkylhydroperoxidase